MRAVEQFRVLSVVAFGLAALLILWCLLAWVLQLQPLRIVILAALGPIVLIAVAFRAAWLAQRAEQQLMDRIDPDSHPRAVATDRASVIPSAAMEPGIRVLNGWQAVCLVQDDEHWPERERVPLSGGEATWLGDWHESWIGATFDAAVHNRKLHPEETTWPL